MNSCIFTGRLARDPEKRTLNNEKKTPCAFYTIAVQDNFVKDRAHFISCQSFGVSVDYLVNNGKKGMYIEFSGQATTYTQKDDNGGARTNTLFVSESVHLIYANSTVAKQTTEPQTVQEEPTEPSKKIEDDLPF